MGANQGTSPQACTAGALPAEPSSKPLNLGFLTYQSLKDYSHIK